MPVLANIGIVFLLLLLNGFFAMAELAIVSARRARLRQLAEDKNRGAQIALDLAEDPASFLSIVQIGVTLNSIMAGAFSGATLAGPLGEYLKAIPWLASFSDMAALGITVVGVTYLNLVVGELVPKRIGLAYAEKIATRVAHIMRFIERLALPVVWMLRGSTELLLKLLRLHNPPAIQVTEEEIKDLIAEGTETGVFKPAERKMIESVMRLADRAVRTIMTPRVDMIWLDKEDAPEEQAHVMHDHRYSRFPVASGDLEEVHGIVHAKDLLNSMFEGRPMDVEEIMRPSLVVPESTPVLRLLEQFRQSGQHIAIVVDEYGSIEGMVTLTDIMAAVTGELPEQGQEANDKPVRREDGSWLVDGMTPVDEVEMLLSVKNMRDGGGDFHTLAGFVIDKLGRIPSTGDRIEWNGVRFEVVDMDARRVDKILISPLQNEDPHAPEEV